MLKHLLLFVSLVVGSTVAHAQSTPEKNERLQTRAEEIVLVLRELTPPGDVFTDQFNAAVPEAQLRALTQQLTSQFGDIEGVEAVTPLPARGAAEVKIRFESAIAGGQMQLEQEPPYRVAGFRLTDFEAIGGNESVADQLAALPGQTSLLFTRLGDGATPDLSVNADSPMAIGSTFKLYVLSALVRSIKRGEHRWDEVVPLDTRSLPSGQMQDWPQGSPVTLHTLATLMISISDNTATDQLIEVLGRDAVEAELAATGHADPSATLPFLTTRELFLLKSVPQRLERYRGSSLEERRGLLKSLSESAPDLKQVEAAFAGGPQGIDVEWLASAEDLARLMDRLRSDAIARGILAINAGVGDAAQAGWKYIGYKGGSEPGVLNFTWLLSNAADDWFVLSMSWNDPDAAVGEAKFLSIAQQVLRKHAQSD